MKFSLPLVSRPPKPSPPDLLYIVDRTDLSVDEKIYKIVMEHNGAPLPFDKPAINNYFRKFFTERCKEDEKEGIVLEEDEEENLLEDLLQDKVVLGDEKDPGGVVKRPPQEAPLEGEPVCKMPRSIDGGDSIAAA